MCKERSHSAFCVLPHTSFCVVLRVAVVLPRGRGRLLPTEAGPALSVCGGVTFLSDECLKFKRQTKLPALSKGKGGFKRPHKPQRRVWSRPRPLGERGPRSALQELLISESS